MFKEQASSHETETVIGPSVKVEGDFVTEGNIVIEGTVCGTVKTSQDLKIGAKSKVFANVSANNALVAGEIQGNVRIKEKLELMPTARIYGDIRAGSLVIASGSIFNGRCQMGNLKDKTIRPDFSKQAKIDLDVSETEDEITDEEENKKKKK